MLRGTLAHQGPGGALEPHHLWGAWSVDPLLLGSLALAGWAYIRGGRTRREPAADGWRSWCFAAGLAAVAVALVSPLDALAGALASAHMVQHMLLLLVAAPLLALGSPWRRLQRGSPPALRRTGRRWARRLGGPSALHLLRLPIVVWLAHVAVIWVWHASVPYEMALRYDLVHILEHTSFFVTGVLFWSLVVAGPRSRLSAGYRILLVFAMAMQSVFLSALLTFAENPWYGSYTATTAPWGLDPLADQQLAGVIMWVPAGAVYLLAALALVARWIRDSDRHVTAAASRS